VNLLVNKSMWCSVSLSLSLASNNIKWITIPCCLLGLTILSSQSTCDYLKAWCTPTESLTFSLTIYYIQTPLASQNQSICKIVVFSQTSKEFVSKQVHLKGNSLNSVCTLFRFSLLTSNSNVTSWGLHTYLIWHLSIPEFSYASKIFLCSCFFSLRIIGPGGVTCLL